MNFSIFTSDIAAPLTYYAMFMFYSCPSKQKRIVGLYSISQCNLMKS